MESVSEETHIQARLWRSARCSTKSGFQKLWA